MRIFRYGNTITVTEDNLPLGHLPGIELGNEEMMPSVPCWVRLSKRKPLLPNKDPLFKHGLMHSRKAFPTPRGTHTPFRHRSQTMTLDLWNKLAKE